MKPPKNTTRYLLTEAELLAVVDAVVTLPPSAVERLLGSLNGRPELAPPWLQSPKR